MRTLVVLRSSDPQVSAELLTAASELGEVAALDLVGDGAAGAQIVYQPEAVAEKPWQSAAGAAAAIAAAVAACSADAVLIDASLRGREIAGYAAGLLDAAVISEASRLWQEGERIVAERAVLSATYRTVCDYATPAVITLTPGSIEAGELGEAGAVETLGVQYPPAASAVRVVSSTTEESDGIALDTADIVVCGGRGVDGDFTLVRELAAALGAAVGATRVCTDEGWIDQRTQIGQTGVVVRPRIYIGLGVSGAVHHTAGMQNSEKIIAVNTDPEAPIFDIADFGIVGDLNEVVPQAIAALK